MKKRKYRIKTTLTVMGLKYEAQIKKNWYTPWKSMRLFSDGWYLSVFALYFDSEEEALSVIDFAKNNDPFRPKRIIYTNLN